MGMKTDIRIMRLNKWHVPKTFIPEKQKDPVILGCFDAIQIEELKAGAGGRHPFEAGYSQLEAWKNETKKNLVDYSSQEQMLFLNICEDGEEDGTSFSYSRVKQFWDSKSPYLFVSMVHINHSAHLRSALKKVNDAFEKDYLSYISFDYCDIVIFAKNMDICDFMNNVRKLFIGVPGEKRVISDTFSMVSFHPDYLIEQSNRKQPSSMNPLGANSKEKFQVTININVRNHKRFSAWYQQVKDLNQNIRRYNLFGRHDISIINEEADSKWLMQIMKLLHDEENQSIFWTFETYIKVLQRDNDVDVDSEPAGGWDGVYENVEAELQGKIEELRLTIDASSVKDNGRYLLPIYEVRDCICSIVKNGFAEEFVYCIYESFLHFVSYITAEIQRLDQDARKEDDIAEGYDKYFAALNTLVNSTMHNERQFVQATAFNAIFYTVPPKIMAFYNAYIYHIKQILKDDSCGHQYTFLIYPSSSPIICVEQISLDDKPPCDRILTVTISEKSLYDIESVMYQMVHELAHYVGDALRCRAMRKKKIMDTLLRYITTKCQIDNETYLILQQYIEKMMEDDEDGYNYLDVIALEKNRLFYILENEKECKQAFKDFYQEKVKGDISSDDEMLKCLGIEHEYQYSYMKNYTDQYSNTKYMEYKKQLSRMEEGDKLNKYYKNIDLIKDVYSECYADLQMILVLAMGAEDYLNTFLVKNETPIEEMLYWPNKMIRISTIFRVMMDCGVWKRLQDQSSEGFTKVFKFIEKYNSQVREAFGKQEDDLLRQMTEELCADVKKYDFENGIRLRGSLDVEKVGYVDGVGIGKGERIVPLVDVAEGLYEYLLHVLKESIAEYSRPQKLEKIISTRELVREMLDFSDAIEVFDCVEKEMGKYKLEGCKI